MNTLASSSWLGPEFDAFLFAPIGEDRNGLPLSIVSLLGRMDRDPWQEAARLAALPTQAAAGELASLLAALPAQSRKQADVDATATRLIALLPHGGRTQGQPPQVAPTGTTMHPRLIMQIVLFIVWLTWLLSTPVTPSPHDTSTHADTRDGSPSALPTIPGN